MKALSLPHLNLSRGSSPSRPSSTPGTPLPVAPSSAAVAVTVLDPAVDKPRTSFLGAALRRSTSRAATPTQLEFAPTPTSLPPSRSSSTQSGRSKSRSSHSGGAKPRSVSSGPAVTPVNGAGATIHTAALGVGGTTTAAASLAMTQSHSQPPLVRRAPGGLGSIPANAPAGPNGILPPVATAAASQLEENYVQRVGLRLSEAINKVFVTENHGPNGITVVPLAPGGGPNNKPRSVPNSVKAKELGDIIFVELQGALHDNYLLRAILRSSIIKSLSLFLTRSSALLLPPTTPAFLPSAPSTTAISTLSLSTSTLSLPTPHPPKIPISIPTSLSTSKSSTAVASPLGIPSTAPPALLYNLALVRAVLALKSGLTKSRNLGVSPIGETLRPWEEKLDELVARVMTPLIGGIKEGVRTICLGARTADMIKPTAHLAGVGTGNESPSATTTTFATLPASAASSIATSTSRALSLGRTSNSHTQLQTSSAALAAASAAWLKDLSSLLIGTGQLISKLEAEDGKERDRWIVAVGTCAVWKGMFGLAARPMIVPAVGGGRLSPSSSSATIQSHVGPDGGHETVVPAPQSRTSVLLNKLNPSPPTSPPLKPVPLLPDSHTTLASHAASLVTVHDDKFLRLLCHLEALERALTTLTSFLSPSPSIIASTPSAASTEICLSTNNCGLCKTLRTFDPESSSEDEDDDPKQPVGGLAHSAMREAMQALSAMIVVVRATGNDKGRKMLARALKAGAGGEEDDHHQQHRRHHSATTAEEIKPLRPLDILAIPAETATSSGPTTPPSPTRPTQPSSSTTPICPTLISALDTLPPLLLLHLLASRLPPSLGFKLPHELWGLEWDAYEKELRGFRAAEEWVGEIGWEVAGEVGRVVGEGKKDEALELLKLAVRRTGVEVAGAP